MSCASRWNARNQAYAAAGSDGASSPFWPRGGFERHHTGCGRWWTLGPVGLAMMILGFIFFWPIGLAILAFNFWNRRGQPMPFANTPFATMMDRAPFARPATGNVAFDEWRRAELERIERERGKLAEAEREFAAFSEELRRAKDREEFERFMQARRNGPAAPDAPTS